MPGPAPKHPSARARRNDPKKDFTSLPAKGRTGKAPAWPLQPDVHMVAERDLALGKIEALQVDIEGAEDGRTKGRLRRALAAAEQSAAVLTLQIDQAEAAESALWAELWSTPQAVMWEQSHAHRSVAQYVRWQIRADQGDLKAAAEARAQADRLGLNPLALLRLRVEIERVDEVETRGSQRRSASKPAPAAKPAGRMDPRERLRAV